MTEKLKYKVGDKVIIEAEVARASSTSIFPYDLRFFGTDVKGSFSSDIVEDNVLHFPPRPKVIQEVMEYCEKHKDSNWDVLYALDHLPKRLESWIYCDKDNLKNQHALATLIAYGPEAVEVEKEKRYRVNLKAANQTLIASRGDYVFDLCPEECEFKFTKQELIDAGFEGVFDNPMFEVEEVE